MVQTHSFLIQSFRYCGDFIDFIGIDNIDVVRDGIDTKFYDNGTSNLLVTLRRTTGLTEADVGVNLFSDGNFAFNS